MRRSPLQPDPAVLPPELIDASTRRPGLPCPVDRLPSRRRNQICIAVLVLGLVNLVLYTLTYAAIGGDAHNGQRVVEVAPDGSVQSVYYVRGHFIHSLTGRERAVSSGAWIYSYIHSITIPLTSGAMIISMLVLARPHILATMRGSWISGRTFIAVFGSVVALISVGATVVLFAHFVAELAQG